jgi:hypothetical protein
MEDYDLEVLKNYFNSFGKLNISFEFFVNFIFEQYEKDISKISTVTEILKNINSLPIQLFNIYSYDRITLILDGIYSVFYPEAIGSFLVHVLFDEEIIFKEFFNQNLILELFQHSFSSIVLNFLSLRGYGNLDHREKIKKLLEKKKVMMLKNFV